MVAITPTRFIGVEEFSPCCRDLCCSLHRAPHREPEVLQIDLSPSRCRCTILPPRIVYTRYTLRGQYRQYTLLSVVLAKATVARWLSFYPDSTHVGPSFAGTAHKESQFLILLPYMAAKVHILKLCSISLFSASGNFEETNTLRNQLD